ncbi:MAG: phosphoribosylaminoimidazolesuccinocarboxamide synthase [Candidatus Micrarchaeia archaeon]|jgi:phosphoribosylaminoimidazole-succinocarboxamide synthase
MGKLKELNPIEPVYQTNIEGAKLLARGKVRDVYDAGDEVVLVATDRLSAFDVVFDDPIPQKGAVLNQIAAFWFEKTKNIVENHFISTDVSTFPKPFSDYPDLLKARSSLVKKTTPIRLECVVRGYLSGSGWSSYRDSGEVCGIKLRAGLKESERLDEPIFTPTTKADVGHDEPVNESNAKEIVGSTETFETLKEYSIALYKFASDFAAKKGIIIADTKFEFGTIDGKIILIDEALTPDSSRFWPAELYAPGANPPSYDKQFVRDYVSSIGWNKKPPAPKLPQNVIDRTTQKYLEAYEKLTGQKLD